MNKPRVLNRIIHFTLLFGVILALLSISFFLAKFIANDNSAQMLIQEYGYIGILVISFVTGLSMISPVPAATFTPVFTAGGIHIVVVIALAVVGTMVANFVSYAIGRLGHDFTTTHYPKLQKKITHFYQERREMLPYLVFAFSAFVPLPDEIYLIPLGVLGIRIREFIIPLVLGTLFFQTITAFGFQNIFQFLL